MKQSILKKGNVVAVYEDPITQSKIEGTAVLLERIGCDGIGETWKVSFEGDNFITERYFYYGS